MVQNPEQKAGASESSTTTSPSPLRIGELLSRNGHIDPSDLALALSEQDVRSDSPPLGRVLVSLGVIDEETLTATLGEQFGMRVVDLAREPSPDRSALARLTREAAHRLQALPMRYIDGELVVVVAEPPSRATKREIASLSGRQPVFVLASTTSLAAAIDDSFPHPASFVDHPSDESSNHVAPVLDIEPHGAELGAHSRSLHASKDSEAQYDVEPVASAGVRADDPVIAWLLTYATDVNATSVHLVEEPSKLRIRVRVNRTMWETIQLPADAGSILLRRIFDAAGIKGEASGGQRGSIPAVPSTRPEWQVRAHTAPPRRLVILRPARPATP